MIGNISDWIYRRRLAILLICIAVYYLLHVSNGLWVDDFWDHSAAVSALIRDLVHPSHAQLAISEPHAFFTPYSVMVAVTASIFGLDAIQALGLFGFLNGALIVYGLRRYLIATEIADVNGTLFYTIILVLYLWGNNPWDYSGFFHVAILKFVLPYPSAFATGMALLGLALNKTFLNTGVYRYQAFVLSILVVVMLTHPVAFVFMVTGLFANALTHSAGLLRALIIASGTILFAVAASLLWPYYPFVRLALDASDIYHASNSAMYADVFRATWPVMAALLFAIPQLTSAHNRSLVVTAVMLLVLYGLAFILHKYSFGRVISYIVLSGQILIAQRLAQWDQAIFSRTGARRYCVPLVLLGLAVLGASAIYGAVTRTLTMSNSIVKGRAMFHQATFGHLVFLQDRIPSGAVVLADLETSWIIPTFGAKVVALLHPHAFVPDFDERLKNLAQFFSADTTYEVRQQIVATYGVQYLLLRKAPDDVWRKIQAQFTCDDRGEIAYETPEVVLIRLTATR